MEIGPDGRTARRYLPWMCGLAIAITLSGCSVTSAPNGVLANSSTPPSTSASPSGSNYSIPSLASSKCPVTLRAPAGWTIDNISLVPPGGKAQGHIDNVSSASFPNQTLQDNVQGELDSDIGPGGRLQWTSNDGGKFEKFSGGPGWIATGADSQGWEAMAVSIQGPCEPFLVATADPSSVALQHEILEILSTATGPN